MTVTTKQQEEMTQQELDNIIKTLKAIPESNDDMARTILKAAADSITLERIKSLTGGEQRGYFAK